MKRLLLPLLAALALPTAGNADLGEADTIPKVKESKETKFDAWCVKKYNECSINLENGRLIVNEGTGVSYEQIIEWSKYNIYRRKIGLINFIGPHHLYTYRFKYKDNDGNLRKAEIVFQNSKYSDKFYEKLKEWAPLKETKCTYNFDTRKEIC